MQKFNMGEITDIRFINVETGETILHLDSANLTISSKETKKEAKIMTFKDLEKEHALLQRNVNNARDNLISAVRGLYSDETLDGLHKELIDARGKLKAFEEKDFNTGNTQDSSKKLTDRELLESFLVNLGLNFKVDDAGMRLDSLYINSADDKNICTSRNHYIQFDFKKDGSFDSLGIWDGTQQ